MATTIITRKAPPMCTICSVLHHRCEVELTKEKRSMFEWFTKKKQIQEMEDALDRLREFVMNRDVTTTKRLNDTDTVLQIIFNVLGIKTTWNNPDEEEAALLKKGNYKLLDKIGDRRFYMKSSSSEGKR